VAQAPSRKQWRKAARLLYQRRVRIRSFGRDTCAAEVRGDTGVYEVTLVNGEWGCTCALSEFRPSWLCSHSAAVKLAFDSIDREAFRNGRDTSD